TNRCFDHCFSEFKYNVYIDSHFRELLFYRSGECDNFCLSHAEFRTGSNDLFRFPGNAECKWWWNVSMAIDNEHEFFWKPDWLVEHRWSNRSFVYRKPYRNNLLAG